MKLILRDAASGIEETVKVVKNDINVSLKASAQALFPQLQGKLLQLYPFGSTTELRDSKYIGECPLLSYGAKVDIIVPVSQPYSKVHYVSVQEMLEKDIKKRPLEDFFDPTKEENDWYTEWTKGEEYLNYPPVDVFGHPISPDNAVSRRKSASNGVQNIWKENKETLKRSDSEKLDIVPKKLTPIEEFYKAIGAEYHLQDEEDTFSDKREDKIEKREAKRKFMEGMEDYMNKMMDRGRSFHSVYVCNVNNFKFTFLHKFEGKWSGSAIHFMLRSNTRSKEEIIHSSSSKMAFDARRKSWIEQQFYTHQNGVTNSRLFQYIPVADGACEVRCDDSTFMESVVLKLREQSGEVLMLTGKNVNTGNIVLTESIVMSSHNDIERRTRTITRFDPNGKMIGVVVCQEQKVIDEETGAIAPSLF